MKQAALKYFNMPELTLLALILFFIAFVFLIYRVCFYEKSAKYEMLSRIPLQDKEGENER